MNRLLCTLVLLLAMMGGACSSNFHSIYRKSSVDTGKASVTMVDAKQRAILQNRGKFCAEPSPDVFSVIAQSASGNAALGKSTDPKTYDAQIALAYASAEQGATIARTQTVNMLRELMFRTCERYLSGSITDLEMPIQAVRDQRMMASMLAIEQLTGTVRPTVVAIGASTNGAAGASNADAVVALDKAFNEKEAADKSAKNAIDDFAKLNASKPSCDDLIKADQAKTPIATADQGRLDPCKAAALKVATTDADQTEATKRLDALQGMKGKPSLGGYANAAGQTTSSVIFGNENAAAVATVASTVERIVRFNYDQDELLLLCLKILTPDMSKDGGASLALSNPKAMRSQCEQYLKTSVTLRTRVNEASISRMQIESTSVKRQFDAFWHKSAKAKSDAIDELLKIPGGDASDLQNLKTETDEGTAFTIFQGIDVNSANRLSR